MCDDILRLCPKADSASFMSKFPFVLSIKFLKLLDRTMFRRKVIKQYLHNRRVRYFIKNKSLDELEILLGYTLEKLSTIYLQNVVLSTEVSAIYKKIYALKESIELLTAKDKNE